ncbi:hypothetical protein PCASD_05240 [Puccinia coronata f. sp. avenae]|uniref:Myb/SANT-like domain-containing protein n=1 Tax=Puccinia coronata f. sp. avenae TaxID=200324 RepID=A0A2N5TGX0_9BASI|nr:hypothetical protein PCASD_05240 [Puccinia coronata f. sp. avenae]
MSFNPFSTNNPLGYRFHPGVTPLSPLGATPCQTPQLQPSQQTATCDIDMEEDPSESQIEYQQRIVIENTASVCKQVKVFWTSKMERVALELYVQAVLDGKQSNNGFKPETHRAIASALQLKFPTGFKKEYDALLELKNQSGFGWNKATWEVTAPEQVWNNYLASHPQARKFKGKSFPEWFLLVEIFEKVVANGANQVSSLSLNGPTQINAQEHPSRFDYQPPHPTKGQHAADTSQSETSAPRVHCATGQLSTGSKIALALKDLVAINQPGSKKTQGAMAMKFLQDKDTDKFDNHKQLAIFDIFYSERRATIYMSIDHKPLQITWLQQAILQK